MIKKIVIVMAAFCTVGLAQAVERNFYMGLGMGYAVTSDMPNASEFGDSSLVSLVSRSGASTPSRDDNRGAARYSAGMLRQQSDRVAVGVELGISYLGSAKYTTSYNSEELYYRFYGVDLLAESLISVTKKLSVVGKIGVIREYTSPQTENLTEDLDGANDYLGELGVGMNYQFSEKFSLGLDYYHTFGDSIGLVQAGDANNTPSIDYGILELTYHF